ncbi:hypothetical protein L3Y34_011227 [Caenorhabditis briggsae]|uniref:Uncharacterized protein n=1 Tax=Caenorhabditis briggsae TaxID=6238 RepID=A0AAE9CU74_CAEBR|nr:hypothetical protein L3Y34_011227 [Caenorhabditis briggsae]
MCRDITSKEAEGKEANNR